MNHPSSQQQQQQYQLQEIIQLSNIGASKLDTGDYDSAIISLMTALKASKQVLECEDDGDEEQNTNDYHWTLDECILWTSQMEVHKYCYYSNCSKQEKKFYQQEETRTTSDHDFFLFIYQQAIHIPSVVTQLPTKY